MFLRKLIQDSGILIALLFPVLGAAQTLPKLPPITSTNVTDNFTTGYTSPVTTTANGTACTTPGGGSCTVVMASTNIQAWARVTLYLTVTGAAVEDNILVEVSPDNSTWMEIVPGSLNGTAAGASRTVSVNGSYRYIRVEARSAATSAIKCALTGLRP